ncbi:hypothetical protein [Entomospira culicis]|uniref:Capsule assembly protein Wzi n=1 Tax=Entomospira culicis TaxID=2719989 RepID=A0A968GG32_9SPIO|nr:hypothetical protein [Entomospira culicis]NIZ18951.1 hypothetical protein [Entomospira culicis]NIZ69166.1 hypothetical protein [Entomospira culicis]WDI37753.1 hypothetical protein PVA46_02925 [Entomospira culicis]WDI39381.1 hypothetical protein PVA47_02930 [Entomospira culicis]
MKKRFPKILSTLAMLLLFALSTHAQTRLSVDINDPVYLLIEIGEVKGLLTKITQVKPYTRHDVYTFLSQMKAREYELSAQERKILDEYILRFSPSFTPKAPISNALWNGGFDFGNQYGHARLGIRTGYHFQFAAEDISKQYTSIPIELFVEGDFLQSMFSYKVNLILNTGMNSTYPFAHFGEHVAMGMGFWQRWFGSPKNFEIWDTGNMDSWAQALEMTPELTGQFWDDRILLRLGILENRQVGSGLILSKDAATFAAAEFAIRPIDWFNFYYMTGSLSGGRNTLGNDYRDTEFHNEQLVQNSKMFSYHIGEFFISDYFYLNVWESVIWGSRMEASYLVPMNVFLIAQNMIGDHDNIAFGFGAATIIPNIGKLETNLMLDEFQGKNIGTSPRNMLAWDVGLRLHIPWLAFTQVKLKYTNIGPYVYSHYAQNYAQMGQNMRGDNVLIDTGYHHRGKALGSFLKPNSDHFNLSLETLFFPGLSLSVGYDLVRHGNSAPHKYWLGVDGRYYTDSQKATMDENFFRGEVWAWDRNGITGELNGFLDYGQWDSNPWFKHFLKDAIYDWTNAFSLKLTYDLRFIPLFDKNNQRREIPVVIGIGYTFAHTFYDFNDRDFSHINDADMASAMAWAGRFGYTYQTNHKNIFTFTMSIFPR